MIFPWGGGISDSYVAPVEIVAEPVEVVPEEVISVEEAEEITIEADEEVVSEEAAYSGLANTEVTSKVMTMGTANIKRGAYIYMGTKSADYTWTDSLGPTWIVLDPAKTNTGDPGMFLLSKELIGSKSGYNNGGIVFNDSYHKMYYFNGSDAQAWCQNFLTNVFPKEQYAILETTKSDDEFTAEVLNDGVSSTRSFIAAKNVLNDDKVFFLSAEEALNPSYGFQDKLYNSGNDSLKAGYKYVGKSADWWLRTPAPSMNAVYDYIPEYTHVVSVTAEGKLEKKHMADYLAARPAFNLSHYPVLFSSAAKGGKTSGTVGSASLKQVNTDKVSGWKLTLRDRGRSFTARKMSFDGSTIEIGYNGGETGTNEYISAIVTDSTGKTIKYYGRVVQNPTGFVGEATINLSGKYASGDRLFVFNEQCNGDYETDYASYLCEIDMSVYIRVTTVSLNKTTTSLGVGNTEQLTATVAPSNATNKNVNWSSSDTSVATVNGEGLVTGKKAGTATITVKTEDGNKTATCKVTVANVPVTGVTLNKTTMSVTKGSTSQLTATVAPSNATNKNVTWSSSDTSVATVSDGGLVKGVKGGTATITVKTADGSKTATCKVTVTVKALSVTLDKTEMSLEVGKTGQLTATVSPVDAINKNVTWASSDPSVATVSSSGLVTAVKPGTATITVRTEDGGFTATCKVTVTAPQTSGSWKKTADGKWWYKRADGSYPKNKWEKIDGKWYHFDAKGYMQTGWLKDGGKWYYLSGSGAMATGWQKISGKWYYFDTSGVMQTGWVKVSGKWYYMNSSGAMQTGWQKISGKWYYFESSGVMLANTSKKIGKKTYTFDKNGVCTNP